MLKLYIIKVCFLYGSNFGISHFLLMLLFAKTGLAKNIQDAITNTVNHLLTEGNKAATAPTAGGGFIL